MITAVAWDAFTQGSLPGRGATLRQVAIPAGRVAARHHHDHEQFLFVASGQGTLRSEAGTIPLTPGTALHLPAGDWHEADFASDTVLIELNLAF